MQRRASRQSGRRLHRGQRRRSSSAATDSSAFEAVEEEEERIEGELGGEREQPRRLSESVDSAEVEMQGNGDGGAGGDKRAADADADAEAEAEIEAEDEVEKQRAEARRNRRKARMASIQSKVKQYIDERVAPTENETGELAPPPHSSSPSKAFVCVSVS